MAKGISSAPVAASNSLVAYIVALIKEYGQSVPSEESPMLPPARASLSLAGTASDRRGPGVTSRLNGVLDDLVSRIVNPDPTTLGALEVDASATVAIMVNGSRSAALSLIAALARRGVHAVSGQSVERAKVRVYCKGEEVELFNHLYRLSLKGILTRILPVELEPETRKLAG